MPRGCFRPLALSLAAVAVFAAGLLLWHRDTTRLMIANARAMSEGAAWAERLRTPEDLFDYVLAHDDVATLVCFDLDDPDGGLYVEAGVVRPTVGLSAWLAVDRFAERSGLDPGYATQPVSYDELARFDLPDAAHRGGATHRSSAPDSTATLEETVRRAWRERDRAALDVVVHLLREEDGAYPSAPEAAAAASALPLSGLFLAWSNHALAGSVEDRLALLSGVGRPALSDTVHAWMARYLRDEDFREHERAVRTRSGSGLSLSQQRAFAHATFPGIAGRVWAAFLARALREDPEGTGPLRSLLETSGDRGGAPEGPFEVFVLRTSGFPGLFSVAGYALPPGQDVPRVFVLMLEQVPFAVFYRLSRTGLATGLALSFLGDVAGLERARTRASERRAASPTGE